MFCSPPPPFLYNIIMLICFPWVIKFVKLISIGVLKIIKRIIRDLTVSSKGLRMERSKIDEVPDKVKADLKAMEVCIMLSETDNAVDLKSLFLDIIQTRLLKMVYKTK
jgi:hypothetical protein